MRERMRRESKQPKCQPQEGACWLCKVCICNTFYHNSLHQKLLAENGSRMGVIASVEPMQFVSFTDESRCFLNRHTFAEQASARPM